MQESKQHNKVDPIEQRRLAGQKPRYGILAKPKTVGAELKQKLLRFPPKDFEFLRPRVDPGYHDSGTCGTPVQTGVHPQASFLSRNQRV